MEKMKYQIGVNERLMKKYNAIVNFLEKNKEVTFENGCLNSIIESVEYRRENIRGKIFDTEDSIVFKFRDDKYYTVEKADEVKIDRKFKTIYLSKYFIIE